MIIETIAIAAYVGDKILGHIISEEIWCKRIWYKINPPIKYKNRLYKCINETIEEYDKANRHTAYPANKFPFYHSRILLDILSTYILFEKGSVELLTQNFEKNPNIIKPSAGELSDFFNLFLDKVRSDKVLKTKFVDENYKEKIFSNSDKLDRIINKLDTIEENTEDIKNDTKTIIQKLETSSLQREPGKELTARLPLLLGDKIVKRENDLRDIRQRLLQNKQVVLVNGMGGIGKTTLAQIYLTEYYNEYKYLIWISINSVDFIADFINTPGLKESLKISFEGKTAPEYFNDIIIALKSLPHKNNEQSLIVIDNVEEDIVKFRDYLPHPPQWHILTTSRHKIEDFDVKELDFLNEEQSLALFKLYYKRKNLSDSDIREIVKELEYHTLTIEILAKTAQNDGLDVQETVNTLSENYSVEVITRHADRKIIKITSYLSSIFDMSNLGEDEMWLLKQFYFLPPQFHGYDTIAEILLSAADDKQYKIQRILSKLVAKGWFLYNEATCEYKLHRIIGDVIKHEVDLPFGDIEPLIESISTLLSIDQTKDNPIDKFPWAIFGNVLLKKLSCYEDPIIAKLQNNLALVLKALGDCTGAKVLLEKAKISAEKNFGKDHPTTARSYSNLASVLQDLGDYIGAKELLEKATISDEKNFGKEHPTTAVSYSNLATVLKDLGDYTGAKELLEKATISDEKNFGEEHPTTAVRYSNLAMVLKDLGDFTDAKVLFEKAVKIFNKALGSEHPNTLKVKQNLEFLIAEMNTK